MTTNLIDTFIPEDIRELYEIHNYRNAAQVLATGCPDEYQEIIEGLRAFRLTLADIRKQGGNESDIPKRISGLLHEKGWMETRIKGDLLITKIAGSGGKKAKVKNEGEGDEDDTETLEEIEDLKKKGYQVEQIVRENFLDGHKVDYVKNRVAFDLEWNSKDQTFDRDLYAFRAFHECDLIDAAVLLTRSASLNMVFDKLGPELDNDSNPKTDKNGKPKLIKTKYGASTTWMGKLLYRLNAGRHGGCPVLALGITPNLITDWAEYEKEHP
ncbi:MAG: BglII/BstYI family type II restriction endonuclease [Methylococcales bacterium]|nr:BglII/BstYI family type II restriction endonuclease [Methylococcales bacterium]